MKEKLTIIKVGGKLLEDDEHIEKLAEYVARLDGSTLVVHGGGAKASEISQRLGFEPKMVDGRRITDAAALNVATMVYAGLYNKKIVGIFQKHNVRTLGMSGADLNSIRARRRTVKSIDYGYVGDIEAVNKRAVKMILKLGVTPVFCAITHDNEGQLLNTNADTISTQLATALAEDYDIRLLFCMDKAGVMLDPDDDQTLIHAMNYAEYKRLKMDEVITLGMIPKLDNAFYALINGVSEVWITGLTELTEAREMTGTRIFE
ncbi:acetylglutamate kinase [Membranicola marinus]|uniref:Acetylglutamate kinase n=1 Tax=Membranihabitans marinus TaxID=1227546 RepID=A0A953LD23_9BACT|nr:acetylglutamate kinase [Membranihabitans marinus]MBY5960116.1 acetylglutamate kinase [Membranihabitans marinus]